MGQGTQEVLETREIIGCPQTMPQITTGHPRIPWDSRNNLLSSNDATNYHKALQRSLRLEKYICCPQTMPQITTGHPRIPWDSRNNLLSSNDNTNYHKAPQRSLRLEKYFVVLKRCHKLPQSTQEVLETREIICCPQTKPQITTGHPRIPWDLRNNFLSSNDATNYHQAPQRSLRLDK